MAHAADIKHGMVSGGFGQNSGEAGNHQLPLAVYPERSRGLY
jgi:hypothetical protein